jgi:murein DD-endopeptidase MepM/ murein hydrolase activator NlpD
LETKKPPQALTGDVLRARPLRELETLGRRAAVWLALLIATPLLAIAQTGASNALVVTLEPEQLFNGSPCVFRVASPVGITKISGTWMGRRLVFDFDAKTRAWYSVAGIGAETLAAKHALVIEASLASGENVTSTYNIPVAYVRPPLSYLSVDPEFLNLTPATRARVRREQALKNRVFNSSAPARMWEGAFAAPLQAALSEVFGARRVFNGRRRGLHQGLDYDVETGTPVAAMNSGRVILARELFYEGGMIVLDHGRGLLTLYLHLSAFRVKEGASVKRGQIIGLSGESGRTTGPHLHVAARWQGVYVDPVRLCALALP